MRAVGDAGEDEEGHLQTSKNRWVKTGALLSFPQVDTAKGLVFGEL